MVRESKRLRKNRWGEYLCGISDGFALLQLYLGLHRLPVICDGEDGVSVFEGTFEGFLIVDVALAAVDPMLRLPTGRIHTATHSTPFSVNALALGLDGSLVMPLSLNSAAALGSPRTDLMTEPP